MSGYMFVIGDCINCGMFMTFAPTKVPSTRVLKKDGKAGPREPLCRACAERLNDILEARGEKRVRILDGAYHSEPCDPVDDYYR